MSALYQFKSPSICKNIARLKFNTFCVFFIYFGSLSNFLKHLKFFTKCEDGDNTFLNYITKFELIIRRKFITGNVLVLKCRHITTILYLKVEDGTKVL